MDGGPRIARSESAPRMNDVLDTTGYTPQKMTTGEFAGWTHWAHDPFESRSGPFYYRTEENDEIVCAFRAEDRHMNGAGFMHGGCLMTFADFALFGIATRELGGESCRHAQPRGRLFRTGSLRAVDRRPGTRRQGRRQNLVCRRSCRCGWSTCAAFQRDHPQGDSQPLVTKPAPGYRRRTDVARCITPG